MAVTRLPAMGRGVPRASRYAWAPMAVDQVLLAAPRGFCAGVEMAIKALAWMVRAFEPPVYCYHEIVHNQRVVRALPGPRRGVRRRHRRGAARAGRSCCSAHGSAPEVVAAARRQRRLRGRRRVPARHQGAPRGEGAGRQGLPDRLRRPRGPRGGGRHHGGGPRRDPPGRVASTRSTPCPTFDQPVALLAQTTLCHRDWAGVARRDAASASPTCGRPGRSDLCFATTNRQSALLRDRRRAATPWS